jgi:flagellar biosynthesis protein FlhF
VVFAISDEAVPPKAASPASAGAATPDGTLPAGMAELERKLERVAAAIARQNITANDPAGVFADAFTYRMENGIEESLAHELLNGMRASGAAPAPAQLYRILRGELSSRLKADASLGRAKDGPRVVALVGPPGAGKTATLTKLAVLHGLATRRPTQLLTIDCYRIAAAEQLRSYAAILGVGFQAVETTLALGQALEEHRHKDLVLIDTPGFGPKDMDAAQDLARFLSGRPEIDTHLVLTASARSADLKRVVDRFEVFRPRKLLFTKLDETGTYGPILNEAVRTGKPVSFLASGQQIPDDLEPATADRILDLALKREQALAPAAAA